MLKLNQILNNANNLVKQLVCKLNSGENGLFETEKEILNFVNEIGNLLTIDVIDSINEPTYENKIFINGEEYLFSKLSNLRFKNRFGEEIIKPRRLYKSSKSGNYIAPLDYKLGMQNCSRYSPLQTYLITMFGADEPFNKSSQKLSETLGFKISSTAVQNNTEKIGKIIPENPAHIMDKHAFNKKADLLIIEIDGVLSPRIEEIEGITGQESLKLKTEYKECNIVTLQKITNNKIVDAWTGGKYGPRKDFEKYLDESTYLFGRQNAKNIVFIADGAKSNWEMQLTNFPFAIQILDFYHAIEHLAAYCEFFKNKDDKEKFYNRWVKMIYNGEILEVLNEMKKNTEKLCNKAEAKKQYNYFNNNKMRMFYDAYREKNYPIGSGLVEGRCKLIVSKRFKGNGMRWKKIDNEAVLRARLAKFNNNLVPFFKQKPITWNIAA